MMNCIFSMHHGLCMQVKAIYFACIATWYRCANMYIFSMFGLLIYVWKYRMARNFRGLAAGKDFALKILQFDDHKAMPTPHCHTHITRANFFQFKVQWWWVSLVLKRWSADTTFTVVSWKRAHGRYTLLCAQTGGWADENLLRELLTWKFLDP